MTNAKQFSIGLDDALDDLTDGQVLLVKKKLTLEALNGVTDMMPVDTGRARGNTLVSVGAPDFSHSDNIDPSGAATKAAGAAVVAGDSDPFAPSYIQNNLPYIEALENGHSKKQAPKGMFAVTAARLEVVKL